MNKIPEDEVIDNYKDTGYLEGFSNELNMICWVFDDYTIYEAGEMFEKFNELVNVRMSFNHYF
ncbi:hypothetical protein LG296_20530 (plasmid) [Ureibacillus chungkukjangi]|uniref:hypothetical protein n=1 Tax=Ureibacillus chungkukjangi TaxID=1202712 RepID=UPI000D34D7DF|nr:hypothetical protein [Ureibacillus chungkukjangi]MCM3390434.1 hypothetical protein [Ureibacillus chungkukjangi]